MTKPNTDTAQHAGVTTTAANMSAALKCMAGLVERRNTIPVLGAVKFGDGRVVGTNLDMEAEIVLPEIGQGRGSLVVDYFSLAALSKHTPGNEVVSVTEADGVASIAFNGSDYRLPSYPSADFPSFPKVEGMRTLTDNAGLVDAIRRVKFAVSREETRYYLNGVAILKSPEGQPMVAATDGHRLAMLPLGYELDGSAGAIIRNETVEYLSRQKGEPKSVTFAEGIPRRAKFEYSGQTISAKLVDGTYPDIFQVVPKDAVPHFTIDRDVILPILHRLRAVMVGNWNGVKITGSTGRDLLVTSKSGERSCKEHCAADIHAGAPFEAGYNVGYLIEAISAFRGDRVTFSCVPDNPSGSPCLLSSQDDALRVVVMPMRV